MHLVIRRPARGALVLLLFAGLVSCHQAAVVRHAAPQAMLTRSVRGLPCAPRVLPTIAYGPDAEQRFDLYLPPSSAGPLPVVVWLHGGGWSGGSRNSVSLYALREVCRGYAVVAADYRLTTDAIFPAPAEDVRSIVRFVAMHGDELGLDPHRVALWGASAGGHLAALGGTTSGSRDLDPAGSALPVPRVRGVVTWWAPVDFTRMDDELKQRCARPKCHECANSPESRLIGAEVADHPKLSWLANPLRYASEGDPPFLVMHGSNDCTVPVEQAHVLVDGLRRAGVTADLHVVPGARHGDGHWSDPSVLGRVDGFLDTVLRD